MERCACPACEAQEARPEWSREGAEYVRCTRCGLVYENPRLSDEELREFYSRKSYFIDDGGGQSPAGYTDYFSQCSPELLAEYFSILRRAAPASGAVRFLDVGCGPGGLVQEAGRYGWQAAGLEISRWAVEIGRKNGLEIHEGTLEEAAFPGEAFDVIAMFDVLEHLPHPRGYLREILRILRPGGVLVVETPNVDGFFARKIYRAAADLVKPRAHICLYSPSSARRLFTDGGFQIVKLSLFPYCRRYTPGYLKRVVLSRLLRHAKPEQLTWNESLRIVARKEE